MSVTFGNNLFVAVSQTGSGDHVMTSPDGVTWTIRTSAADNGWVCVTFGNNLFVAVSHTGSGNLVMTSSFGEPSGQPTSQPTRQPTSQPTGQPTNQPTGQPTNQPTSQPSTRPTPVERVIIKEAVREQVEKTSVEVLNVMKEGKKGLKKGVGGLKSVMKSIFDWKIYKKEKPKEEL